jgi:hypothetical protein
MRVALEPLIGPDVETLDLYVEAEARAHGKTLSMTTAWITRLSKPSQTFVSKGFGYSTGMTTLILDSTALKATAVQTTDDTLGSLLRFHPSASL